jgi:hypothetical protein
MAQVCKLSDDIEILTHFAIWPKTVAGLQLILVVNYNIDDSESVTMSRNSRLDTSSADTTRETGTEGSAQAAAPVRASPSKPHACSFPLTPASKQAPALTSFFAQWLARLAKQ